MEGGADGRPLAAVYDGGGAASSSSSLNISAVLSHLPVSHVRHIAALAEELHHFLARPRHLRPPGFRFRVFLYPPNLVPVENEVHLSQSALGRSTNRVTFFPNLHVAGVRDECLPCH